MPQSPADSHAACPSLGAILYAASGGPLLDDDDIDVAAHAHLQHCADRLQIVAEVQTDDELIQSISLTPPWLDRLGARWPTWTTRQRSYFVALITPRLLLLDLRMSVFRWWRDLSYGIHSVRVRRAARERKLALLASIRRERQAHHARPTARVN